MAPNYNDSGSPEEQLDRCEYLFFRELHEPTENSLRFVVEKASAQEHLPRQIDPALDDALAGLLRDASPILPDSRSRSFEIGFDSYISYAVSNESYGRFPRLPEVFKGKLFRIFEWSHLLEFTKKTSYASDEHPGPGPLLHFEVVCLNHVVDVISAVTPSVRTLGFDQAFHTLN